MSLSIERDSNNSDVDYGFESNNQVRKEKFVNIPSEPTERQIVVTGRYKQGNEDVELICFSIYLGLMEIVCICNIPQIFYPKEERRVSDRPETEAPVYVKFKLLKMPRFGAGPSHD